MSLIRSVARHGAAAMATLLVTAGFAAPGISAEARPEWTEAHKPFRIYGNTYYVGSTGLSSVLITSDYGHVLIDTGLPESAAQVAANIQALGFKLADVKGIVISHAHPDHVGGVAELQRLTGAQVYAMRPADEVLRTGKLSKDDPQVAGKNKPMAKVPQVWVVTDDQLLGIGSLRIRVMATPGHTPGGTSWTWDACDGSKCLATVYADSVSAVSQGKYRFSDHPEVLASFEGTFKRLEAVKCELLITPHPEASGGLARLEQGAGDMDKLKQEGACQAYAKQGRENLARRLAEEKR